MPDLPPLTDLEHLVLLVVATLGDEGYGVLIREEVARHTGRDIAIGSVYAALERLERRKLLEGRRGEPTAERGGRAKKHFGLLPAGREALASYRAVFSELWSGIDGLPDRSAP